MMILKNACPNCGGEIEDELLLKRSVCRSCLDISSDVIDPKIIGKLLRERGKLLDYRKIVELEEEFERFREEFKKATGNYPWYLQEVWAKLVLQDESFSIIAPTGVGKSLFCLVMALYLIKHKNRRCYIIFSSSLLVDQASSTALDFMKKLGIDQDLLAYYHSGLKSTLRDEMQKKILEGKFKLLITTDRFLIRRIDEIIGIKIDNIFVDDAESLLRTPKNIDKILKILGFSEEIIHKVFEMIKLRSRLRSQSQEIREEYEKLLYDISREKNKAHGKLVVAGATLGPNLSKRIKISNELLGFDIGVAPRFLRNIIDFRMKIAEDAIGQVVELIKLHGGGVLVLVSIPFGKEFAKNLTERLNREGIDAYLYEKMEEGILQRFSSGEFKALVGFSTSRSPFVRGINLPETIRYAIFIGVPRREIRIDKYEVNPNKLYMLLTNVLEVIDEDKKSRALRIVRDLKKIVPARRDVVEEIGEVLRSGKQARSTVNYAVNITREAAEFTSGLLTDEFLKKIEEFSDVSVKRIGEELRITIPDVKGYLQASGRTSRLYVGGVSRGVCILLNDDEKTLVGLTRRLKSLLEDFEWIDYDYVKAVNEFMIVDKDRELIRKSRESHLTPHKPIMLREALMIVESPNKARTIAKFFGRPSKRKIDGLTVYTTHTGDVVLDIVATMGHVTDLSIEPGYHGVIIDKDNFSALFSPIQRCEKCGYQFVDSDACPSCGSTKISSKKSIIDVLRKIALSVNEVYIATDPDSEGEKIAYDLTCLLRPFNPKIFRIEFHEVTRRALISSLADKHSYSRNLVSAQLVRRIEDRWFGFELSRKLWEYFGSRNLSAGRVQTPVLGWIVKRMEEAKKKKTIMRVLLDNGVEILFENPENLDKIMKKYEDKQLTVKISEVSEDIEIVNPPPPYITATLLQDAFTYLRYPVDQTMMLAQELFESGFITYHRTDSTTVSTVGLNLARDYIDSKKLGEFKARTYAHKGAHECIRPVRGLDKPKLQQYIQIGLLKPVIEMTDKHLKLYDLIFRRFIASQMSPAVASVQTCIVNIEDNVLRVKRIVDILDEGFNKLFPILRLETRLYDGEQFVKEIKVQKVPAVRIYSEGDIIHLMRERRIGRPSTYSRILQVLYDRSYIFENRGKIISTSKGRRVYEYLEKNFSEYISEETTRELEEIMDKIEDGEEDYLEVLKRLREQAQKIALKTT